MVFFHQNESSNSLQKYVLVSIFGIPGSILGMYLSDSSLGRKGTMIAASFVTASFLYLFTVFISPFEQLILSCVISFAQNAMYGVLYAYTPELFHVSIRGKATGLANSLGRLSGVIAPLLTGFLLDYSMYIPLWLSASMIYTCTFLFCMLPA
jgi:MFS family permease